MAMCTTNTTTTPSPANMMTDKCRVKQQTRPSGKIISSARVRPVNKTKKIRKDYNLGMKNKIINQVGGRC